MRILVVDSDNAVTRWLRNIFEGELPAVDAVSTAGDAARRAVNDPYDFDCR
jgi:DNA-binding response OmpR family regulator